jgi:magnesium-protoporphyrin O-methyltransferase
LMSTPYLTRRTEIETYFDRTAVSAWEKLTSDAPVSGVRARVRAGRDEMRTTLLSYLPTDLRGVSILDAGCGTGALAVEAARRGASVTAIDLSPQLVGVARERLPKGLDVTFISGDMLDPALGKFDHVVAMDSIIHYPTKDMIDIITVLSRMATTSMVFSYPPRTLPLAMLWTIGKLFPRGDKSPAIEPQPPRKLQGALANIDGLTLGRKHRVATGFYISEAQELLRA